MTTSPKKRNPPKRTGKVVGVQIPFDLLKRMDAWRDGYQIEIQRSAIMKLALEQFLDREERKK